MEWKEQGKSPEKLITGGKLVADAELLVKSKGHAAGMQRKTRQDTSPSSPQPLNSKSS